MKPIVKKTLASKKSKKEKLRYLLYAYKEQLIVGVAALALVGTIVYSFTRPKTQHYTIAVVSETAESPEQQMAITNALDSWMTQTQGISGDEGAINFISYQDAAAVQAFTARLAGGDIQAVFYQKEEAADWQKRFGTEDLAVQELSINERSYYLQLTGKFENESME